MDRNEFFKFWFWVCILGGKKRAEDKEFQKFVDDYLSAEAQEYQYGPSN